MTSEEVIELAHRLAWRYKKEESSDPHHSDTFTFNRSTLLEFARKLEIAEREACAQLCELIDLEEGGTPVLATDCAETIRTRSNAQ